MAKYKLLMVKWVECKNRMFEHVELELRPGEKWIIALFQDESSFHAGEYKLNIW